MVDEGHTTWITVANWCPSVSLPASAGSGAREALQTPSDSTISRPFSLLSVSS